MLNQPIFRKVVGYTTAGLVTAGVGATTMQAQANHHEKSLYDNRKLEIVYLEDQPSRWEVKVKEARLLTNQKLEELKSQLQGYVNSWVQVEKQIEESVLSLVPEHEKFVPNALYVGIIALSGTVVARNRNIFLRLVTPLSLGLASSYYFLPGTTVNTYHLLHRLYKQNEDLLHRLPTTTTTTTQQQQLGTAPVPPTDTTTTSGSYQSPELKDAIGATSATLERTVNEVESLYTTRSDPGVRPGLEAKDKVQ